MNALQQRAFDNSSTKQIRVIKSWNYWQFIYLTLNFMDISRRKHNNLS